MTREWTPEDDGAEGGAMTLNHVRSWSSGSPKRILIDSMIVDLILTTLGLTEKIQRAGAQGALVIVETHILQDQLSATREPACRRRLLEVYDALPKETVATSGFVLGVSKLGEAELADDVTAASIGQLTTPRGLGGRKDALLAITAARKADAIVTEDTDLLKRLGASPSGCDVWRFDDFRQFVEGSIK